MVCGNGKNWQGSAKLSPLSLLPPPSEFCNDEKNSVIRSAMDALRNLKKISLLAVAILFLFTFFDLILDARRTLHSAHRIKIRLIEGNAKFRHLKKFTCKRTLRQFFICLRPRTTYPPPLYTIYTCKRYTVYILIHTKKGGSGGK